MTDSVRVPPVAPEDFTPLQAELIGDWKHLTFSRVLLNSPRMYPIFVPFIEAVIARTVLPPRDRQVIVLRTLTICEDVYERTHHITISRKAGLSEDEIAAFQTGTGDCLTAFDRVLVRASEELKEDQVLSDATWAALAERYSTEQLMDVVYLSGCYVTMAMLTKSFGIELEGEDASLAEFNKLRAYT